jgi:hypothetical protein
MSNRRFLVIFSLIILLVLGLSVVALRARTSYLGRASEVETYSLVNSYLFGSPLSAAAGGQERIRISAFLLSDKGRGVPNKKIEITSLPPLTTLMVQPTTDNLGQAIFEVSSPTAGQFSISASVQGQSFPQTVTLFFR